MAHPVVLAPTEADRLEHRVGDQHDPPHRPAAAASTPVSSSACPARPPQPSWRMRARIGLFSAFLRSAEARLPPDAAPAVLAEAIDQTKRLLERLTKRLRQATDARGDKVVNLR